MTTEADPLVGVPVIESAATSSQPLVRPRWEGGVLALIAALAGFASAWIGGTATSGAVPALLILVAVIAVIASFSLAWPAAEPLRAQGMAELRRELDRARRHRRPFAIVRMSIHRGPRPGGSPTASADGEPVDGQDALVHLVGASLRITDRAWREGDAVVIMQPETDRVAAEAFTDRLRALSPERFTAPISIAVFPDDGLTSGALLEALDRADRGDARPEPLTRAAIEASAIVAGDRASSREADDRQTETG